MTLLHHFPLQETTRVVTDVVTSQQVTLADSGYIYGVPAGDGIGQNLIISQSTSPPSSSAGTFAAPSGQHTLTFLVRFEAPPDPVYRGLVAVRTSDSSDPIIVMRSAASQYSSYGDLMIGTRNGVRTKLAMPDLVLGKVYHVALALDPGGSGYRAYVDGQPFAGADAGNLAVLANESYLFAYSASADPWRGGMAQLRIWSHALTADEVQTVYQQDLNAAAIEGVALLSNGDPASNVYAVNTATLAGYRTTPDGDGSYSIAVPPGTYLVVADGPAGYRPLAHKVVSP